MFIKLYSVSAHHISMIAIMPFLISCFLYTWIFPVKDFIIKENPKILYKFKSLVIQFVLPFLLAIIPNFIMIVFLPVAKSDSQFLSYSYKFGTAIIVASLMCEYPFFKNLIDWFVEQYKLGVFHNYDNYE